MEPIKITTIPIHPATNVRSTQNERWLFKVDEDYLEEYDKKKYLQQIEAGIPPGEAKKGRNAARKRQLEKYNAYKKELLWWAAANRFVPPHGHFAIWFYVPHPPSWRKDKIEANLYRPHVSTPDADNFIKAYLDGLFPRKKKIKGLKAVPEAGSDDRKIHCYTLFKVWVTWEEACIKVLEYAENDFLEVFKHGHPSYTK